jgi:hypothetical protein
MSSDNSSKDECLQISIWGFKVMCRNPSNKTIIILIIVMVFMIAITQFWRISY